MRLPAIQIAVADFIEFHFEVTTELGRLESQKVGVHPMGPRQNLRSAPISTPRNIVLSRIPLGTSVVLRRTGRMMTESIDKTHGSYRQKVLPCIA